jgi:membrane protein implicated in regulation of membrane protease activity
MDKWGIEAWQAWLALGVLLGVAEMFSLDLILIMLAVGAFGGMATAALGAPLVLQALVAAAASVGMLALVRPNLVQRLHGGPELTMSHHRLVGQQGVVTQELSSLAPGQVRVGGDLWTAAPYDETQRIAEGETVEVLQIRGATAYVHPVARLEP